jgi:hypothetical protein
VTARTRATVIRRDEETCQFDGRDLSTRIPQGDYSLQHRRARGMGGSKDPETNDPANLVLVCGSATTGCHGYIEQHREHAIRRGFNVPQRKRPTEVALQDWHGQWWFLEPDGTRLAVPPPGVTG